MRTPKLPGRLTGKRPRGAADAAVYLALAVLRDSAARYPSDPTLASDLREQAVRVLDRYAGDPRWYRLPDLLRPAILRRFGLDERSPE